MGRGRITAEPLDPAEVRASFRVRQDSQIIRASTGEVATFVGPGGRVMCRVYHDGKIKRLLASRVAWVLGGANEWPHGVVRHRDSDEHNFAASHLIETKRGPRPFDQSKGGKRSALHERQASDAALLRTLAEHQGALTVPQSLGQSAMLLHKAGQAGATRFGLRAALQRSPPLEFDHAGRGACRIRQSRGPPRRP
jgi:hypothetical protein